MNDSTLSRPNRFTIDLRAIAHNLGEVRRMAGEATSIFAALKANAYGFGLDEVAGVAVSSGADGIAVADLGDAVALRGRGIAVPILLYAGNLWDAAAVATVEAHGLMPTIFDRRSAETIASHATRPIRVFVKVDVGLERLGLAPAEAAAFVAAVQALPNLELHGLYTHIDVSGDDDAGAYVDWQLERYARVCRELEDGGVRVAVKMAASSAVLRLVPDMRLDAVDPGHMIFGLWPPGPARVEATLQPAFHGLTSRLIHTRAIDRTEFVERSPIPLRDGLRIGVMPIGIRDGLASLTCGEVLVRGGRVPILGGLSLEHARIDLTDVPDAEVGDEVAIIGRQGAAEIRPDEVIEHQGFAVKAALPLAVRGSVARVYLR